MIPDDGQGETACLFPSLVRPRKDKRDPGDEVKFHEARQDPLLQAAAIGMDCCPVSGSEHVAWPLEEWVGPDSFTAVDMSP
jgi:hypothetical protein